MHHRKMGLLSAFGAMVLGAAVLSCAVAVRAQHSEHTTAPPGVAAVPPPAVAAVKPAMRKPRPQLGTGLAFAPDGSLWLVGVNAQGRLYLQTATAQPGESGWQWGPQRLLDTTTDPVSADGENRPKLLFGPKGVVLIAYTQPLEKSSTGYVRMLRSTDAGQTFSAPYTVHTDRQIITHRFESLAFDGRGVLHAVWIDKRDLEAAPRIGNKSSYRGAAIYRNTSSDGGATFGPDVKVADHSCECCRIALAQGADGQLRAMWRHVFVPNVRDHAVAILGPGTASTEIVRATFDEWRVDGCPHHGPALTASDDGFHAVWFGIRQEGEDKVAGIRYARLRPDGSPHAETLQRIPDARAERPDVLAIGQRVAVVWRSTDGMTSKLMTWLSIDGGRTFRSQVLDHVDGDNDYPRLVRDDRRMVVVWRNAVEVKIHEIKF